MKITLELLRAKGKRIDNPVLAEGEVTGHTHTLDVMEGRAERYELNGKRYLAVTVEGGISITHEEHGVGIIAPGIIEERLDREYDYAAELARNVAD
jgi:hypothetical protein